MPPHHLLPLSLLLVTCAAASNNDNFTARHAFIHALPFRDMKLDAPVVTSLSPTSLMACGVRCMENAECQAVNYHVTSRTCQLLSDFWCSRLSDLVVSPGQRYYDVERNGDRESIRQMRADQRCQSDGRCSPKCTCPYIAFVSYIHRHLLPDDVTEATVAEATGEEACLSLCVSLPLPECRGVNVKVTDGTCQFVTFVTSERSPDRLVDDENWDYHKRQCMGD